MDTWYILEVGNYQVNLGDVESLFLRRIADGVTSAYGLFLHLKSNGKRPMAYKNVNKRVKRLEELNLIQFEKRFKRNAKHYKLTTKGLLYLISNYTLHNFGLLTKYKDNIILQTLLYRYFEYATIKKLTAHLYLLISQYLRECCFIVFDAFSQLGESRVLAGSRKSINPYLKWIEEILEWHAKSFAVKLSLKYIQKSPRTFLRGGLWITLQDAKPHAFTRNLLSKDIKFMKFLETVAQDFEAGYKDLLQLKSQND